MTHTLVLYLSVFQYVGFAVPLALLLIFMPTPFVSGGLFSTGVLMLVHFQWIRKHHKEGGDHEH